MQSKRFLTVVLVASSVLVRPAAGADCSRLWTPQDGGIPAAAPDRSIGIKQIRDGNLYRTVVLDPDREVYDAQQSASGGSAIISSPAPAEIVLFYGQSNASSGAPDFTIPARIKDWSDFRAVSFATSATMDASRRLLPTDLNGIAPLQQHATYTLYPASQTAFALGRAEKAAGRCSPGRLFYTVWKGASPAEEFYAGGALADNLFTAATAGKRVLGEVGRPSSVTGVVFIQGEAGPWGGDDYAVALNGIADTIPDGVRKAAGQDSPPELFILQTNQDDGGNGSHAYAGQLRVAKERFGKGVTLIGPSYQFPLRDAIHTGDLGRKMEGELIALVYDKVTHDRVPFAPLWPVGASRKANVIEIRFNLPGKPLAWDTAWVKPAENYGFRYVDDAGSATIRAVEIVGVDTVRITLDREPTGQGRTILYAVDNDKLLEGWAAGRGQLISPSTTASALPGMGEKAPALVNHYAVRFKLRVP